jgi:alkylglycerol monooxygenase
VGGRESLGPPEMRTAPPRYTLGIMMSAYTEDPWRRSALCASLLLSGIYAATFVWGAFPGAWLVKALCVALLAFASRRHGLLALALALCSIGDALLDLDARYFAFGLAAFLLGHLTYAACFLRVEARARQVGWQWAIAVGAGLFLTWLWPELAEMRLAVLCYFAAITLMVLSSFRPGGWVLVGALLFLLSDALLATHRFRMPLPLRDWWVWGTYYAGQFAITAGYARCAGRSAGQIR